MSAPLRVALPDQKLLDALQGSAGVELLRWDLTGPAPEGRIDLLVPPYMGKPGALAALEGVDVGLVQSQSIGYDGVADVLPEGCVFANAAGVHETSTAELALGMMIANQRGMADFARNQATGTWDNSQRPSLADRRVLLVGYGGVGKAIEARLLPFETEVTRMASREREDTGGKIFGIDSLYEQLPLHEIVVVSVPLSEQTRQLVDAKFLAAMPDGALLVNVARGPVADTNALLAETSSGRLRAALDVTDPEPLPADHPLWTTPGVLITPHVGGASSAMFPRMVRLVKQQIGLMLAGKEPVNVVLGGAPD
ncbi:D-isomer specific 2-hydroxyacid dehydrogenase,NAD binding domain protein [Pseudarthrobacter siccitolerans]|uniref:D-isomer specific 2-hydroxyacid dehydrogenase,NAD binding domain protein n=1 Tax=Pseudarthrobacter siccitolerans TaxID=861266 RepID=A0A024H516_9MICC|nr:2-hydroxyacid dehydrogenase [Pseudarthrobacter siccitolerans]CCQ47270.1 D-isomer specific 2-hydroxyacid dehydrogenase,NAD binding domain protein [Pseudarthrobacter siccitolerans]